MLVLAGPGSGKTFTITNRIACLTAHRQVRPEHILVITFTKDAALSMQNRFRQQWGGQPVNFGTFHAIFYQIIRQSCGCPAVRILKTSEKRRLIGPVVADFRKTLGAEGAAFDAFEDGDRLLAAISYYKNTGNMEKSAALLDGPWGEQFSLLLEAYEKARRRSGTLDFDDMVYECRRLLQEKPKVLEMWRNRFIYLMIDEFQDINPMQYQVVRLLAGEKCNLFAVGDDDQSIYGFRGSDPSLMKRFLEDYPQAQQLLLDVNYRSRREIVEASLKVINENKNRFPKALRAHQPSDAETVSRQGSCDGNGEGVRLLAFPSKEEQYRYLLEQLAEKGRENKLEQCAALFRTNAQMQGFAARLSKEGISYRMKEKAACIYDHFIAEEVNSYVRFALGERTRSLFLRIMNKPSRWLSREMLTEETVSWEKLKVDCRRCAAPGSVISLLEQIDRLERDLERLSHLKPYLGIQFLRRGIGYEDYLRQKAGRDMEKRREWQEVLEWLTEEARQYASYQEWFSCQEAFRETFERAGTCHAGPEKGISLMTAHASKGLEFPYVYLPDVNEGVFPHSRMAEPDVIEEERRMLYVAMTRAKEALELLYVTGTQEQPGLPSRFLQPLINVNEKI